MVIAVVSDLMMASKIRTAAGRGGAELRVVATAGALLEAARAKTPSLVLLDLDDRTSEPIAVLAAIRSERSLASVRVIAFVSHVRADLVAAARQAGADEVLARSAFVARLGRLLSPGEQEQ